ncbi:plasma-membrane proton-efflux P-type ATPase [Candidatus Bathyarchaeota archaeon A05DMB-2]|jgi:H+-transporting ATPase|nr:plasma-membrane proton-efflux P-type ATPase [Candidatus Bathyarchaeota archaeon A05DMB-2]
MSTEEAKKVHTDDLFKKLSSSEKGLSSSEAEKRLQQYGANEIPEKKVNPFLKFLSYFWGPIPWMIEAAVVMSAIIGHWPDFGIITLLLMMNAVVGFWQEHQAGNAIGQLKKRLALKARVLRDGKWQEVPAAYLVPGDMVRLRLGDIIPADVKLVAGEYLLTDESALTGESLPVEKHASDVGYSGSIVKQGEMNALVVNTGLNTFFGKTTKLVEEAKTQSHFQKAVVKIGDYLISMTIALVVLIFLVFLFRGQSVLDILQFVLVLTVAAIPAALPAVLSVTMALGAMALAKKEAIVTKLVSIEEMAGMDVLCADKTGTITQNSLTVSALETIGKFTQDDVLLYGMLASREEDQDPIDNAIIAKSRENEKIAETVKTYTVVNFKPFDPVIKRTEATLEGKNGKKFKASKGAPQVILSLVKDKEKIADEITQVVEAFAEKGYRALGVAKADEEADWRFVGLLGLQDPPREDSAETIKAAETMGVKVKMVTGDHIAIAKEISREVGLGTNIVLPSAFVDKHDVQAREVVEEADGFAEVFPEHKYDIVKALQSANHIVGMTGDGVNDAPALKKADAGIAVSGATDAAKSAADIVLTKSGISVIIDSIRESRKIFQRMNNYSIYRMAETIRILIFITSSILIFQFFPITALMIVLLAILNDLPIITIAVDYVRHSELPEKWDMRMVLGIATVLGIFGVLSTFGLLYIGLVLKLELPVLQSFIYLKLSVAGHFTVFMARTRGHFWERRPAMPLLLAVVLTQLTATLITVYGILLPAMGWGLALLVWGYAIVTELFLIDFIKVWFYRSLGTPE